MIRMNKYSESKVSPYIIVLNIGLVPPRKKTKYKLLREKKIPTPTPFFSKVVSPLRKSFWMICSSLKMSRLRIKT